MVLVLRSAQQDSVCGSRSRTGSSMRRTLGLQPLRDLPRRVPCLARTADRNEGA